MNKIRSFVFILIVSTALSYICFCIASWGYAGVQGETRQSYLEGRTYQSLPTFDLETLSSGKFQDEFEQFVSDAIPYRESVVLANATMQRKTIETAAIPCGFRDFPTFFGSNYILNSTRGSISEYPDKQNSDKVNKVPSAISAFNKLMETHPAVQWRMALVDRSCNSTAVPAHDLVSQPADYRFYQKQFLGKLSTKCVSADLSIDSDTDYYELFFKTDHHWQIEGAYKAYRSIVESLGKDAVEVSFTTAYKGPFYGSEARNGRCTISNDVVDDISYNHSNLAIIAYGKEQPDIFLDTGYSGEKFKKK